MTNAFGMTSAVTGLPVRILFLWPIPQMSLSKMSAKNFSRNGTSTQSKTICEPRNYVRRDCYF